MNFRIVANFFMLMANLNRKEGYKIKHGSSQYFHKFHIPNFRINCNQVSCEYSQKYIFTYNVFNNFVT